MGRSKSQVITIPVAAAAFRQNCSTNLASHMDGNRVGVRGTPHGFQAFCSRDSEEIHLGFFEDLVRAEHVADLGSIKAALEKGRQLQAR